MKKPIVMIPTYNEADNIAKLIEALQDLHIPKLEVLVVDDNSPDGTWKIVKDIARKDKHVHLLHRTKDKGRGTAGIAGFQRALELGADVVVEMDADFSHNPKYLPSLLRGLDHADVVLGSRRVPGGADADRPLWRRFVTFGANWYIRILLGLKVKDCNSGYRCFRRNVLEAINLNTLMAKGPDIVQEVLFKAHLKGFRIMEVPIVFVERKEGNSKLGMKHLYKGYIMVLRLKLLRILRKI